ncbi:hypothetical protein EVAR_6144_1 [Eumeta japonica]|uniref:Uncharacterized protein n=1 Tax=Eumeta variegata TaxID=151549 RepID=A0A4C1THB2_EUMVA|nr:hypothetical protein EVAR_6144_1 [Eumeta japonica]
MESSLLEPRTRDLFHQLNIRPSGRRNRDKSAITRLFPFEDKKKKRKEKMGYVLASFLAISSSKTLAGSFRRSKNAKTVGTFVILDYCLNGIGESTYSPVNFTSRYNVVEDAV